MALVVVVLALILIPVGPILLALILPSFSRAQHQAQQVRSSVAAPLNASPATGQTLSFGPVVERVLTNLEAINLASDESESLPKSLAEQNRSAEKDFAACAWLERVGLDIAYLGDKQFYAMTRDITALKRDSWESCSPVLLAESLHDIGRDGGAKFGDSSPLNNPTNYTFGFKTRESRLGLLQIISFTNHPPGVKIRYKLVQRSSNAVSGWMSLTDLKVMETKASPAWNCVSSSNHSGRH